MAVVAAIAVALAGVGGWLLTRSRANAPERQTAPPAAAEAPTAPPAAAAELPAPELGVDAKPAAVPTAAPPPATAPAATPVPEPTRPAAHKKYTVQFSSIPPATLSVDGRVIGPSVPAQRVELEEGTHRYKFEASGLPAYEQSFKVGSSGVGPIAYQFPVGTLVLQTDPSWIGAAIIVDGKYKATVQSGTERVRLAPGAHRLIVLREGFQPANRELSIEKGAEVPWQPGPAVPIETGG